VLPILLQQALHSACSRFSSSAPRPLRRYQCGTGETFNLCQGCWDRHQRLLQQGSPGLHAAGHSLEAHGPQMTRHGAWAAANASSSNPWGNAMTGGSVGRARERLRDRTGL
jgi:hypothetical protein